MFVEVGGRLEAVGVRFRDVGDLRQTISRLVGACGRRIDDATPLVDARLPDGSRVNAVLPPLAVDGPLLTVRRFGSRPLTIDDLVALETLTQADLELVRGVVRARLNVLVSGGTSSGKTTTLGALSAGSIRRSASSPSRTPPSCGCSCRTWRASSRGPRASRGAARSTSASSSATRCACGPIASSSARCAAAKRSTCCSR